MKLPHFAIKSSSEGACLALVCFETTAQRHLEARVEHPVLPHPNLVAIGSFDATAVKLQTDIPGNSFTI